jgi:hypothetical protein
MKNIYSVFNLSCYKEGEGVTDVPNELEPYLKNDFDIEEFRESLIEHQRNNSYLNKNFTEGGESLDEFNSIIHRITNRGKELQPFNKSIVRILKYGKGGIGNLMLFKRLIGGKLNNYSSEELVQKYCTFFAEQAEDFGSLFYHVVNRENKLVEYSNELISRSQFYHTKANSLEEFIHSSCNDRELAIKTISSSKDIGNSAKKSLCNRINSKYKELVQSEKMIGKIMKENESAMDEIDGLVQWCSGIKSVVALGKERMDNYSIHLKESLETYLQISSLNRGFKETNNAVDGLIKAIDSAQMTANNGLYHINDFIKNNGIYMKKKGWLDL